MGNNKYEELYDQLYQTTLNFHKGNKTRLRRGLIAYFVLPIVLVIIRYITDSDKTFFLILWVFGMFVISAILIGIEYMDDKILKTLNEFTDREAEFDDLIDHPAEEFHERVRSRIADIKSDRDTKDVDRLSSEAVGLEAEVAAAEAETADTEHAIEDTIVLDPGIINEALTEASIDYPGMERENNNVDTEEKVAVNDEEGVE